MKQMCTIIIISTTLALSLESSNRNFAKPEGFFYCCRRQRFLEKPNPHTEEFINTDPKVPFQGDDLLGRNSSPLVCLRQLVLKRCVCPYAAVRQHLCCYWGLGHEMPPRLGWQYMALASSAKQLVPSVLSLPGTVCCLFSISHKEVAPVLPLSLPMALVQKSAFFSTFLQCYVV